MPLGACMPRVDRDFIACFYGLPFETFDPLSFLVKIRSRLKDPCSTFAFSFVTVRSITASKIMFVAFFFSADR